MTVQFRDVFKKSDWVKITILIIVAAVAWTWVYIEYKKPILPPEYLAQLEQSQTKSN